MNFGLRLDEILMGVWHTGYNRCNMEKNHADGYDNYAFAIAPKQAKQALTSLIKELVAEANLPNEYQDRLLKMLENENGIDSTS